MTSLITIFSILFCCSLKLQLLAAENNKQCLTPSRAAGICINLDQCQVLFNLLGPSISQEDIKLLSSSQCGYVNKTVQVCCPIQTEVKRGATPDLSITQRPIESTKVTENSRECSTPTHAAGICINLDQCEVLLRLLVPTINQADSELLRSSQCGYVNKTVQVCCPNKTEAKSASPDLNITERPAETTKQTANGKPCVTPNQENATCIELEQCGYLLNLLQNVNLTDANKEFLKLSQCSYENNKVMICCPDHQRVVVKSPLTSTPTQPSTTSILPSPPHCGLALSNRIYGGSVAGIDEFPWLALVEYTKSRNEKGFHCGGSLINDRYVLTAAHCTKGRAIPRDWTLSGVRLGEYDITTNPDCEITSGGKSDCNSGFLDVSVEKITAHAQYDQNSRNKQHDIALLRLATVVTFTAFIKPICLPSAANLRSEVFTGTAMDVAGWGRTETSQSSNFKLKATVNVVSLEKCSSLYSTANISLERTHMCAGGVEGVDSCSGDSGGPLMVLMNSDRFNVFFVAGIVSYGPVPCGRDGWPGVYTRVGSYISWIQDNVLP